MNSLLDLKRTVWASSYSLYANDTEINCFTIIELDNYKTLGGEYMSNYPDWLKDRTGNNIPDWAEERWGDDDDE